ncbi:GGDEF domain-containing protein [Paenibacillus sp. PvR098]|uniref:sensor domain-containing diguanylate cyclase n=1 Tax=unclassified Paenibacillus TaxID=185978 RepID=UPI001B69BDBF|nr:diguanylate cyclase (GGDEF)-like protein [Paenibacillus sp. PvP091]MBP1171978.1 diguanylate cyclase (GGDEF)-like protein [Paenibacillus sp. PvR098]MBP2438359.1 diguanylate cyclase (GGDEF)-like protein [Paenibacillus sp. PvP052]
MSIIFLYIYRIYQHKDSFSHSTWPTFLINTYAAMYILMGVLSSINSQGLTGNVDAYIIILISVAVVIPLKPRNFLIILLFNHMVFLVLLSKVSKDEYTFTMKQINTTATAVIAFFIAYAFYNYKRKDFIQHLKLKESEKNFRTLFTVNPYPLVLSRIKDDSIALINPKAVEFFRIYPSQIHKLDATVTYPDGDERLTLIQELTQTGSIKNYVCKLKVSPHMNKWAMINYEIMDYENEKCVLAGITDITELKKMEDELTKHASIDALTGVMNRRQGMDLLHNELIHAQKQGTEFIVCFVDINNLKEVNDRYGHAEGDHLIIIASQVLKNNLGQNDFLFRHGGDEFIIIFHNNPSDVYNIWERIRGDLNHINQSDSKPYDVSVSYGLFQYQPGMKVSVDEMIELADQEMYKDKRHYKLKDERGY